MTRSRFVSPFPSFQLSEQDEAQLFQLSSAFVASSLAQFESYTEDYSRLGAAAIDEKIWKFVRERENLRAFTGRSQRTHKEPSWTIGAAEDARKSSSQRRASSMIAGASQSQNQYATDDMPVVLVVGSVRGSFDDMMYGIMNNTVEIARIKNSYVDDMETDLAVLATLTVPTREQPYESFTIKWCALEQAPLVRSVVKKRDFVYMEMTGIAQLERTGERVGYHMVHSLHFPQTPELESCVRGNISIAAFCRQSPDRKHDVQLCVRGVVDPRGHMLRAVAVANMAAGLTSLWRNVDCANLKKLAWLMARTRKRAGSSESSSRDSSISARTDVSTSALTYCATCKKLPVRTFTRDARRRRCNVCWQYVCSSCKIKKKLSYIHADRLLRCDLTFCSACVFRAVSLNSRAMAQHDAVVRGIHRVGNDALFSTTGSDISDQL